MAVYYQDALSFVIIISLLQSTGEHMPLQLPLVNFLCGDELIRRYGVSTLFIPQVFKNRLREHNTQDNSCKEKKNLKKTLYQPVIQFFFMEYGENEQTRYSCLFPSQSRHKCISGVWRMGRAWGEGLRYHSVKQWFFVKP